MILINSKGLYSFLYILILGE